MKFIDKIHLRFNPDTYFYKQIRETKSAYQLMRKNSEGESIYDITQEENLNLITLYDEWNEIKSDKIIKIAQQYELLIPKKEIGEYWQETIFDFLVLSSKGRKYIKDQYREELHWKRERTTFLSSIFFGFIGLLIGLLSIIFTQI